VIRSEFRFRQDGELVDRGGQSAMFVKHPALS